MTTRCHDQFMPDKGNFAAIVQPVVGTLDTYCGGNGLKFQSGVQGHFVPVMHSFTGTSHAQYAEGVGTLRASGGDLGGGSETIVSIQGNLIGRDQGGPHGVGAQENAPMYTLTKGDVHAVAFRKSKRARDENDFETWVLDKTANTLNRFDAEETRTTHAIAHAFYSTGGTHGLEPHPDICPPIKVGSALGIPSPPAVAHTAPLSNRMTVRRLTPVECERLQGFPDGWTLVPYRGKPSADGPRYKALGNSMAVPCMAWIGARIAMVEAQNAVS